MVEHRLSATRRPLATTVALLALVLPLLVALPASPAAAAPTSGLVITGVIDGPLSGGVPKAIEVYVVDDVADLSSWGLGSANNGDGTDGEEFTFPAVAASAGDHLYVASDEQGFIDFFGSPPDYTSIAASLNGDDAIELFENGVVVDVFGEIDVDGTGQPWEYLDGWAYRDDGTGRDGSTFALSSWTFSGPNALDGETTNDGAATPWPLGTYAPGDGGGGNGGSCDAVPIQDVQGPGDATPLSGQEVTVRGTVTADFDALLVVQDTSPARNGVVVFSDGNTVDRGDDVCVTGVASERFGQTQVGGNGNADATIEVLGTGAAVAPVVVTTDEVATGSATAEDFEGVLVRVEDVTVTDPALGFGEFAVDDGSGPTRVDDEGDATYVPVQDDVITFVQGPLFYSFDEYKIEPRDDGDIGEVDGGGGEPVEAFVHDVQGDGSVVEPGTWTVEAIVTSLFLDDGAVEGFFVQEEDADADTSTTTSEGIFVFCGSCPTTVAEGDLVQVTGESADFFEMSQLVATTADAVQVVSQGNPLPTPTIIDLPVTATDLDAFYEQREGMLVTFAGTTVVSEYFQLARFGEVRLFGDARPFQYTQQDDTPTQAEFEAYTDALARNIVRLDDDDNDQNSPLPDGVIYHPQPGGFSTGTQGTDYFRGGDTVTDLTGVLHWSFAGASDTEAWRVRPTTTNPIAFTPVNTRPAAPDAVGGDVKVASFNVLNYFATIDDAGNTCGPNALECRGADSESERVRQLDKIVAALDAIDADVVGLIELENDADDESVGQVVTALNAVSDRTYAAIETGSIGGDAIKVAFIHDTATTTPTGAFAVLDSSVDPRFVDDRNRPILAQTFTEVASGEVFTASVAHLKSKGSPCDDIGDPTDPAGAGNCNQTRTDAVEAYLDWVDTDPTDSGDPDHLLIGDLNSYAGEDPIAVLTDAGWVDLAERFVGADRYGYVFDGQLGTLDYVFANPTADDQATGATEWHVNADEVNVLDYNDTVVDPSEASFEAKPSGNPLYEANAFRSSDHDPAIAGFDLGATTSTAFCRDLEATIVGTSGPDVLVGTPGRDVIAGLGGDDTITGLGGNDVICGGEGDDTIDAGPGQDIVDGDAGEDDIQGGTGNDGLNGGPDADVVRGGPNNDLVAGDGGDDELYGDLNNDWLLGGPGLDVLRGGNGNDLLLGGDDDDELYGEANNDALLGQQGDDDLWGGDNRDVLRGGSGLDELYGEGGMDELYGGSEADLLDGGPAADFLRGDLGADTLLGGFGFDTLEGGPGDDDIDGGLGVDDADGGTGTDTCTTVETAVSCELP